MNVAASVPTGTVTSFPGVGLDTGTTIPVYPGAFSVTETGPDGYAGSTGAECSGTIELGASWSASSPTTTLQLAIVRPQSGRQHQRGHPGTQRCSACK